MTKKKKQIEIEVASSMYEIWLEGNSIKTASQKDAEKRFRNSISKESYIAVYLYRHDYDNAGNLIETYMLA